MLNYWQQFINSGKIEDYLSYVDQDFITRDDKGQQKSDAGVHPYAGIRMCDRNDIEADAYR